MPKGHIDEKHLRRLAATLCEGDLEVLAEAVQFCGEDAGRKGRLLGSLERLYDIERRGRLEALVRKLSEADLTWLCDDDTDLGRPRR
jgi:ATP phosphoribosyltransferase regulatory subunit HisZ